MQFIWEVTLGSRNKGVRRKETGNKENPVPVFIKITVLKDEDLVLPGTPEKNHKMPLRIFRLKG